MIDEKTLRVIIREEIGRLLSDGREPIHVEGLRLTVPECVRRYRCRRETIFALIRKGELTTTYRAKGKNGKPQYLIEEASAERHPQLGNAR